MADALTAATAGATAGAVAAASGMPEAGVMIAAIIGAGVSVWVQHAEAFRPSWTWFAGAISTGLSAIIIGIAAPVLVRAWAPSWELTKPALLVPAALVSLLAAAAAHFLMRIVAARVASKLGNKEGAKQ